MRGSLGAIRRAGIVLGAGVVAAGCSASRPALHVVATTPGSSTSAPRSTTSTSSTSSGSSTSTSGGGVAHCVASDLVVSVAGAEGAAGTFEVTLQLRNSSTAPCATEGYPSAQLYDKEGAALPTSVVPGGSYSFTDFAPAPVTLAPGASAYFNVAYSDVPTGTTPCSTAASMWVFPPGDVVDHLVVAQQFVVCDNGRLTVSPVFGQGSPQTQTTAPAHP